MVKFSVYLNRHVFVMLVRYCLVWSFVYCFYKTKHENNQFYYILMPASGKGKGIFCSLINYSIFTLLLAEIKVNGYIERFCKERQLLQTGPSCSKLAMSLVSISLKLWSLNMASMLIFLLKKMWVAVVGEGSKCLHVRTISLESVIIPIIFFFCFSI